MGIKQKSTFFDPNLSTSRDWSSVSIILIVIVKSPREKWMDYLGVQPNLPKKSLGEGPMFLFLHYGLNSREPCPTSIWGPCFFTSVEITDLLHLSFSWLTVPVLVHFHLDGGLFVHRKQFSDPCPWLKLL